MTRSEDPQTDRPDEGPPVMEVVSEPAVVPTEVRPPTTKSLALWWPVALGAVIAMVFVWTDHMLRATATLGGSLLIAAIIRAIAPQDRAGGLVVRSRAFDVIVFVIFGVAILASGFTLDLRSR
ncbi:DUF3017 domain-containing protein [Janibacter sp. GXQ6167]|uniref:DUF3017 domain-containing protein n=1 Tax=Janibacter sp. GXQ6167 TaxID=3240791 RepID=UPI003526047A